MSYASDSLISSGMRPRTSYALKELRLLTARFLSAVAPAARCYSGGGPLASIDVLEAHDVVLAQVRAGLHLDDLERDHARVLDPVLHAYRDVGRLVLFEEKYLLTARD